MSDEEWKEDKFPEAVEEGEEEQDMLAYALEEARDEDSLRECTLRNPLFKITTDSTQSKKSKMKRVKKWKTMEELNLLEGHEEERSTELNSLPVAYGDEWELIEAAVDSGATDSVGPAGMFSQFPLKPSEGSLAGKCYVSATKHQVPNLGERVVEFMTDEGLKMKIKLQEAAIGKVLISAAKLVENHHDVSFRGGTHTSGT